MAEIKRANTAETLEHFHELLDGHFKGLHQRRQALGQRIPVFALEHGLHDENLKLLRSAVLQAHQDWRVSLLSRRWWLPFAVHAAEVGYVYDGHEFWPIYAEATPAWDDTQYERERVRSWFNKFADEYGGALPQGSWAKTFRLIAWPITHAVLPRYLQMQLARMLADFRTAWPDLLDDPAKLGVRLHSWSRYYGDRLEKFCQNTALVGHVAVALLLAGEDEESPFIEPAALARLVKDLNSERQTRRWLQDARNSASTVRMHNFQQPAGSVRQPTGKRLPAATDPKLQLKRQDGTWEAYAVLPDLKPLQHILPAIYDELRESRAVVAGAQEVIRTGALLYATAPLRLASWPWPTQPFLQLQHASTEVNLLIAEQCRITSGPWWVFRRSPDQPAVEVKGKFIRPGGLYCIVGAPALDPPDIAWCEKAEIAVDGVGAYDLKVPTVLDENDSRALVAAGISVISDVSIRPVGIVASSWDGEGSVEWLAGEPALIAIHAQHSPSKARLTINDQPYYTEWPAGEIDLFLSVDGLGAGTYEIRVSIGDPDGDGRNSGGTLIATIRDPQVRSEAGSSGEGIRLRTEPAQPSLPELWDGRAVVEVDGPEDTNASLEITLRDAAGTQLGSQRRSLRLPVTSADWPRVFRQLRDMPEMARHYDEADVGELSVSRAGIGIARLTCERGFRGLRWIISTRHRGGGYAARLIDRADGDPVSVEFFSVEHPVVGRPHPADQEFVGPPRGGLLWATNGEQVAGQIIPPDPNQLLRLGIAQPSVPAATKCLPEVLKLARVHRQWNDAELPAHPFGVRERQRVLDALTTALAIMLTGGRWGSFEERIAGLAPADVDFNEAQSLVGDSLAHRAAGQSIASNLWRWNSPEALVSGFGESIAVLARSARMKDVMKGARFLLQLASSPGDVLDWEESERNRYLQCLFTDPVLMRAARFAVLGTMEDWPGGIG